MTLLKAPKIPNLILHSNIKSESAKRNSLPAIPTMNFGSIATAVLFQLNVKNMGGDLGGGFENFRPLVHRRTAIAGAVFRSIGFFKRMALEELGHALRLVGEHVAVVIENRALSVAQPLSDDS